MFDCEQETRLVKHIKHIGVVRNALTRTDVVGLGTEYAVHLEIKTKKDKPLSLQFDRKIVRMKGLETKFHFRTMCKDNFQGISKGATSDSDGTVIVSLVV